MNQNAPAPTGIVALKEAARRWLCVVLEHAGWIGRELGLCLSPSYRPDAVLADGYCKALRWRLRPTVHVAGQIDMNALAGYGVKPISLMSALSRSGLGEDFPKATRWLWRLLEELPADVWTNGQPPTARLVGDWWKATDMLRGCLASTWAWMDDDFSDVEGLPEGIASIFKRGGFPELSDDELAELGAWLKANASEVYHGLDRSNLARAPRIEEAKKCFWAIYECNTTLRRAVAPTVSQGGQQVPSFDEPGGAASAQDTTGSTDSRPQTQAPKRRKRGRKRLPPKDEQRRRGVLDRWERASSAGISRKKFCDDEGITMKRLENFQRWAQQRENRGQ